MRSVIRGQIGLCDKMEIYKLRNDTHKEVESEDFLQLHDQSNTRFLGLPLALYDKLIKQFSNSMIESFNTYLCS